MLVVGAGDAYHVDIGVLGHPPIVRVTPGDIVADSHIVQLCGIDVADVGDRDAVDGVVADHVLLTDAKADDAGAQACIHDEFPPVASSSTTICLASNSIAGTPWSRIGPQCAIIY